MVGDDADVAFFDILGSAILEFMKQSKSVFPNALLSEQDFQKDAWKRCMVFVFMARWVFGKDGQKQWRLFDMSDLKFNMRAFEMWKRREALVMRHTARFQELPETCADVRKRKRLGRGRYRKGEKKKGRTAVIAESSSASESPMKRVTFDLTAFSDGEMDEDLQIRPQTPPTDTDTESDAEAAATVFKSDEDAS